MSRRAVITGITGQDGSYLAELLLEQGYHVVGVTRRLSSPNYWRIEHLLDRIELRPADLLDQLSLLRVIADVRPHEFYNLAAMSFVPASWDQPFLTGEFNSQGVTRVLEAIRHVDSSIRVYQASSSEMFGTKRPSSDSMAAPGAGDGINSAVRDVVALFPSELLLPWTRDSLLAQSAGPLAALLIVGTALNCLMVVPYALPLASGWTSLSVKVNVLLTVVAVPAVVLAARQYDAIGAAAVWPMLMASYVAIALPLVHRRLLPGFGTRWFYRQVFLPICVTLLTVVLCRAVLPTPRDLVRVAAQVALAFIAAQLMLAWATPTMRRELLRYWSKLAAQQRPAA